MKESEIQKKITDSHRRRGYIVVKLIQTTMNGIPDLMLIRRGKVKFVEVKCGKNKSSPLQCYQQKILREAGVEVYETNDPEFKL